MAQNFDSFNKFAELIKTNPEIAGKLQTAIENYSGEQTEEAVFEQVVAPLAEEAGISATYKEFQEFRDSLAGKEATDEELGQIAGGKDGGMGATACCGFGAGVGFNQGGGKHGNTQFCVSLGFGFGAGACFVAGAVTDEN